MAIPITREDFEKKFGHPPVLSKTSSPSFLDRVKQTASQGMDKMKSAFKESSEGRNPISTGAKLGAGAIETAFSPVSAALEPVVKPTLGKAMNVASNKLADLYGENIQLGLTEVGKTRAEGVLETAGDLSTIAGAVIGPRTVPKVAAASQKLVSKGVAGAKQLVPQSVKDLSRGTANAAGMVFEETKRLPSRISTNVAEKQATRELINKLPTKTAQEAARDGVDVADINLLYKIPRTQKPALKKLTEVVQKFSKNETTANPIEIIGKPIVNRMMELEKARGKVGSKLGATANSIGEVSVREAVIPVLERLKRVPGLDGLEIDSRGILNFDETVLATLETKADRAAIQRIFSEAIKTSSGKKKHLLRQELFEALGGKKAAKLNLTATQERAYEAIRQGLSDVLEGKNSQYKALSNQYRKIIDPIKRMRKLMKAEKIDEDVLDMSAGLLARRLTSLATSNPEIRSILNAMDTATKGKATTRLSVETLQDFYNVLEKYYDIAPKTGFQAQVKQGVEKATGVGDFVAEQARNFAGQTPAVRQKALERVLHEALE